MIANFLSVDFGQTYEAVEFNKGTIQLLLKNSSHSTVHDGQNV